MFLYLNYFIKIFNFDRSTWPASKTFDQSKPQLDQTLSVDQPLFSALIMSFLFVPSPCPFPQHKHIIYPMYGSAPSGHIYRWWTRYYFTSGSQDYFSKLNSLFVLCCFMQQHLNTIHTFIPLSVIHLNMHRRKMY